MPEKKDQVKRRIAVQRILEQVVAFKTNRGVSTEMLIRNVENFLKQRVNDQKANAARIIDEARTHVERVENTRKMTAPRFNIFHALGVTRKENVQSRFLAYLLSPQEHHQQGAAFLNCFLCLIRQDKIEDQHKISKVIVTPEVSAGDLGRMDIVIRSPDLLVVIENKIDAGEREQQLSDYSTWLSNQGYTKTALVFLTPCGRPGQTGEAVSLSYAALAKAFEPLIEEIFPDNVREVFLQYLQACRSITFGESTMVSADKELIELLTKPDNIRIGLEIEQQMALARKQIAAEFCGNIKKILDEKINAEKDLSGRWRVLPVDTNTYSIDIATYGHLNQSNYRIRAEYIFWQFTGKGWVGWYRPRWVELKESQETEYLTEKMKKQGFKGAEAWWVASKSLRDGAGGYVLSDNDDMIACHSDNREKQHPLATSIADKLWSVFSEYRSDIEALDSFKSALE